MATTKLRTADDLWAIGERGGRYELIEGALREMSPAGGTHGEIAGNVFGYVWLYNKDRRLGSAYIETGFVLARDPDVVLAPDVAFVRRGRVPRAGKDRYLPVAPDLAVEVLSPGDAASDVEDQVRRYLDAGTALVRIFHQQRRDVTAVAADGSRRVLNESDELDGGEVLPGFRLRVADVFEGI